MQKNHNRVCNGVTCLPATDRTNLSNSIPIMAQNEAIFAELDARLDVSEAQAEWCDHCNEGHPAPLD